MWNHIEKGGFSSCRRLRLCLSEGHGRPSSRPFKNSTDKSRFEGKDLASQRRHWRHLRHCPFSKKKINFTRLLLLKASYARYGANESVSIVDGLFCMFFNCSIRPMWNVALQKTLFGIVSHHGTIPKCVFWFGWRKRSRSVLAVFSIAKHAQSLNASIPALQSNVFVINEFRRRITAWPSNCRLHGLCSKQQLTVWCVCWWHYIDTPNIGK